MIADGERLKYLIRSAQNEIILCAPFIKFQVVKILFDVAPPSIPIKIITRWRAEEVAAGVSDLEVFDLVIERPGAELLLYNSLHAKLYVADDKCLVGSANLTCAALGWSENPNLEILILIDRSNSSAQKLLEDLASAIPATHLIKSEIAAKAEQLKIPPLLDEERIPEDELLGKSRPWLPKCSAPQMLFELYSNPKTGSVVSGTKSDGMDDLRDLGIPKGLSDRKFQQRIAGTLLEMDIFKSITEKIPGKIRDEEGIRLILELCPEYSETSLEKQWQIIRDWISVFFADRYEIAPIEFEIRLR